LIDELEEEHRADQDYHFHRSQIEIFRKSGANRHLVEMLVAAMGAVYGIEVIWSRE
jgi:hypothetical protein